MLFSIVELMIETKNALEKKKRTNQLTYFKIYTFNI